MTLRTVLTALMGVIFLSGCCHKKGCLDVDSLDMLHFFHFKPSETDTVIIKRFEKSSGFTNKTDSVMVNYSPLGAKDTLQYIPIPFLMTLNSDWEISIPATGAIYRISDFQFTELVCNPCWAGNDYYTQLKSYQVNGTRFQQGAIILYR